MTSHRDENDLTDDEVLAMWDEGEPVELVGPSQTFASPWVRPSQAGQPCRRVLLSFVDLKFYGPKARVTPRPYAEPATESTLVGS
jgi:hypothetical protein